MNVQTNEAAPVMSRKRGSGTRRNPAARYVGRRVPGTMRLKMRIGAPRSLNQRSLRSTLPENLRQEERSNQLRPAKRARAYNPASPAQMPRKHAVNAAGQEMVPAASNRPAPTAAASSKMNVAKKKPAAFHTGSQPARASDENGGISVMRNQAVAWLLSVWCFSVDGATPKPAGSDSFMIPPMMPISA